jgi:hypothetical protein
MKPRTGKKAEPRLSNEDVLKLTSISGYLKIIMTNSWMKYSIWLIQLIF